MLPPARSPVPSASGGPRGLGCVGNRRLFVRRCRIGPRVSRSRCPAAASRRRRRRRHGIRYPALSRLACVLLWRRRGVWGYRSPCAWPSRRPGKTMGAAARVVVRQRLRWIGYPCKAEAMATYLGVVRFGSELWSRRERDRHHCDGGCHRRRFHHRLRRGHDGRTFKENGSCASLSVCCSPPHRRRLPPALGSATMAGFGDLHRRWVLLVPSLGDKDLFVVSRFVEVLFANGLDSCPPYTYTVCLYFVSYYSN